MTLKLTIAASLTALTLLATGSALAAPGVATGAVNIREDAGTQFDIIGSLKKGEFVDIIECDAGWCEISDDGEEGYVAASHLALVDSDDEDEDDEDYGDDYDDVDVDFEYDYGGVEIEFEL
jgi:uncharacterized protein YraI